MSVTKQLLILGNGFDLHCGLKSSYKDFFENEILDLYSEKCGYPKIKQGCSGFWEGLLFQYYLQNGNEDYNWCDIEKIIMETLWQICFGNNINEPANINSGIWIAALQRRNNGLFPIDEYVETKDIIYNYLLESCTKNFYSLSSKINRNLDITNLPPLLNALLYELNNFENRFCKYIKNLIINPENEQEIRTGYIFRAINLLVELSSDLTTNFHNDSNIFKEIKDKMIIDEALEVAKQCIYKGNGLMRSSLANLQTSNILSFNYTNVFDVLPLNINCKYTNVHGKLCTNKCDDCNSCNIIFGVDDAVIKTQNDIPELRLFSKTFRKMQNPASPTSILPNIEDYQSLQIKFYGHSLSSADYSYFQSIFDYYNIYDNTKVSLIFYYSKGYEQYDAIYELINTYGTTLTNKDQGKNLMHKLLLENRLKILEIE